MYFRKRQFYGRTLVEVLQSPGETIYLPHYTHHAAYNLDETVSAGDNPFYSSAIEEVAFLIDKSKNNYTFAFSDVISEIFAQKG